MKREAVLDRENKKLKKSKIKENREYGKEEEQRREKERDRVLERWRERERRERERDKAGESMEESLLMIK